MRFLPITILSTPPPRAMPANGKPRLGPHPMWVELAEALREATDAPVELRVDLYENAPATGFVLTDDLGAGDRLADWPEPRRRALLERTVLLSVPRTLVFEILEEHEMAGVLSSLNLGWWTPGQAVDAGCVHGRIDVAERLGVSTEDAFYRSERYALIEDDERQGLIERLVAYLDACAEVLSAR